MLAPERDITLVWPGADGIASIPIDLICGNYPIEVSFDGDDTYMASKAIGNIDVKTTIELLKANYTYNAPYAVKFLSKDGNVLANGDVKLEINGIEYKLTTDSEGFATQNINLAPGSYNVKATNTETGEVKTQTINVLARLSQNKDITMYYGAGNVFKVKVLDENGNIAVGVKVTVKVGSKNYYPVTASNGYASVKIASNPGKYNIITTYKGFKVTNKLTVKSTLVTKDISVKKGKTITFTAKLLNTKGKILKNKLVTFKFKGKTSKIKTNAKGIATLKVTKKYNPGNYTIKTTYGKLTVSNKITIKK